MIASSARSIREVETNHGRDQRVESSKREACGTRLDNYLDAEVRDADKILLDIDSEGEISKSADVRSVTSESEDGRPSNFESADDPTRMVSNSESESPASIISVSSRYLKEVSRMVDSETRAATKPSTSTVTDSNTVVFAGGLHHSFRAAFSKTREDYGIVGSDHVGIGGGGDTPSLVGSPGSDDYVATNNHTGIISGDGTESLVGSPHCDDTQVRDTEALVFHWLKGQGSFRAKWFLDQAERLFEMGLGQMNGKDKLQQDPFVKVFEAKNQLLGALDLTPKSPATWLKAGQLTLAYNCLGDVDESGIIPGTAMVKRGIQLMFDESMEDSDRNISGAGSLEKNHGRIGEKNLRGTESDFFAASPEKTLEAIVGQCFQTVVKYMQKVHQKFKAKAYSDLCPLTRVTQIFDRAMKQLRKKKEDVPNELRVHNEGKATLAREKNIERFRQFLRHPSFLSSVPITEIMDTGIFQLEDTLSPMEKQTPSKMGRERTNVSPITLDGMVDRIIQNNEGNDNIPMDVRQREWQRKYTLTHDEDIDEIGRDQITRSFLREIGHDEIRRNFADDTDGIRRRPTSRLLETNGSETTDDTSEQTSFLLEKDSSSSFNGQIFSPFKTEIYVENILEDIGKENLRLITEEAIRKSTIFSNTFILREKLLQSRQYVESYLNKARQKKEANKENDNNNEYAEKAVEKPAKRDKNIVMVLGKYELGSGSSEKKLFQKLEQNTVLSAFNNTDVKEVLKGIDKLISRVPEPPDHVDVAQDPLLKNHLNAQDQYSANWNEISNAFFGYNQEHRNWPEMFGSSNGGTNGNFNIDASGSNNVVSNDPVANTSSSVDVSSIYQAMLRRGLKVALRFGKRIMGEQRRKSVLPNLVKGITAHPWIAVYPPYGGRIDLHAHQGSLVSCVMYPQGSAGTAIGFVDPRGSSPLKDYERIKVENSFQPNAPFHQAFYVFPKAGDVVCFPSYLIHFVPKHIDTNFVPKHIDHAKHGNHQHTNRQKGDVNLENRVAIPFNLQTSLRYDGWFLSATSY